MTTVVLRAWWLSILISSIAVSQTLVRNSVTDFLISEESTPSMFHQSDIRIFPKRTSGFLTVWQDDRDGEQGFYAQEFDTAGDRVGRNFQVFSNKIIRFTDDGSFLAFGDRVESWLPLYDLSFLVVDGRLYDSSSQQLKKTNFAVVELPWCGTGYLGVDYHCASTSKEYLFLLRNDGHMSLAKYDRQGNLISQLPDSINQGKRAAVASIAANVRDEYMVASFQITQDYRPVGYIGTFFGSRDSVIAADVDLGFPVDTLTNYYWTGRLHLLRVIPVADTAYEVFDIAADSAIIYFRKFDTRGNPLSDLQSLPIPHAQAGEVRNANFSVSTVQNNSFNILVTNAEWDGSSVKYFNALYPFSADGTPIGAARIDTAHFFRLGESFNKNSDSTFLIGAQDLTDVYLTKLVWFTAVDGVKVNDDQSGSNEISPFVTPIDDGHFFVSWQNGEKNRGQVVDLSGARVQGEMALENRSREFFHDGTSVSLWLRGPSNGPDTLGFTVWNSDWTEATEETVAVGACCSGTAGVARILTDSTFVVLYTKDFGNAWVKLFDKYGELIAQASVVAQDYVNNLRLSFNDANSFWVHFGVKVRLFSNGLSPLTDGKTVNAALHLEDRKFLTITHDYYWNSYYGAIVTTDGDTINRRFLLASGADEISFGNLTPHDFLVLVRNGTTIYARTFTNDGVIDHDSVVIHSAPGGNKKQATYSIRDGKVFFAWSEVRSPGIGYSIFGSVMDLSMLVSVEERPDISLPITFSLAQNYPNPFNAGTTIRFDLPKESHVVLKVYTMLGQEAMTVLDEKRSPGRYDVRIDGTHLASGIYFYRLATRDATLTKKFVMLK